MFEHLVASHFRSDRRFAGAPLFALVAHATVAVALVHAAGRPAAPAGSREPTLVIPFPSAPPPRTPPSPEHGGAATGGTTGTPLPPAPPAPPVGAAGPVLPPTDVPSVPSGGVDALAAVRDAATGGGDAGVGVSAAVATPLDGVPPRPLAMPEPLYPAALRASGLEGAVELEFVVDAMGRVDTASTRVVGPPPAPPAAFVASARAALAAARFVPARVAGGAIAARVRQRVVFRLTGGR